MDWVLTFIFLWSAGVILGTRGLLLFDEEHRRTLLPHLVSYAMGTLLGGAFLSVLPRARETGGGRTVLRTALAGLIPLFVVNKRLLWWHFQEPEYDIHSSAGLFILVGQAFHNFVDGFAIASAFLLSVLLWCALRVVYLRHQFHLYCHCGPDPRATAASFGPRDTVVASHAVGHRCEVAGAELASE